MRINSILETFVSLTRIQSFLLTKEL